MTNKLIPSLVGLVLITLIAVPVSAQERPEFGLRLGFGFATHSTENTGLVSIIRDIEVPVDYTDDFDAKMKTGFQIGGFVTLNLGPSFALQPEFLYTTKGVKVEGARTFSDGTNSISYAVDEDIKFTYLEIPILLKYRIPAKGSLRPSLFAGPSLAFKLSAKEDMALTVTQSDGVDEESMNVSGSPDISNATSSDIGLVFGGDVKLKAGSANFILDVRYTFGTSKVFESVNPDSIPHLEFGGSFPSEFPNANLETGEASDAKNRAFSITLGVSIPM